MLGAMPLLVAGLYLQASKQTLGKLAAVQC